MMNLVQYLRVISIGSALAVGIWIPLRLIDMELPHALNLAFDLMVSVSSAINLFLFFKEAGRNPRRVRDWMHPSAIVDLLCALPLIYLDQVFFGAESKGLFLLNLLSARHIWRIKVFLDEFHSLMPVVYRLVPIALTMPLLVHLVACEWIHLGSGTAGPDSNRVNEYIKAIYWAFTTLTTVGYGDISAKTPPQMLFASFVQITGVGVFGFVLSNVASLLSRLDAAREHHMESLDRIETFMKSHQIPPDMRAKVRTYYHYLWKNNKGYQDHALLQDLPSKMQSELFFFINRSIIEKVPLLRGASADLIEDLMNELKPKIVVPGERFFKIGEHGDSMYFINNGSVEILNGEGGLIATLGDGSFFGEMALVSEGTRNATAKASTYTNVYMLSKSSFQHVVETYPEFHSHIQEVMSQRQSA